MPRDGSETIRESVECDQAVEWLSLRLYDRREALAAQWLERLVDLPAISAADGAASERLLEHVPELISDIAEYLRRHDVEPLAANRGAMQRAAALGELRFAQRASVHQLLRDYQMLADILEGFILSQVHEADPPLDAEGVLRTTRCVTGALRALQQQTIDTFISKYTATIERQNEQLLSFGRVVAREIRQPLAVLQLMSSVLPISTGDFGATHLIDVLDRNVKHLADVAARLEHLSRTELEIDVAPREQTVNLTALVDDVVKRLAKAAASRGVRCVVDPALPLIEIDPPRMELVFLNLIANGIKYSDPGKSLRVVEIRRAADAPQPTVMVRDNGVGMPQARARQLFRELTRPHPHRDHAESGLGLGLSIVRECMDACGGTVTLESIEGEGTTVTLSWRK